MDNTADRTGQPRGCPDQAPHNGVQKHSDDGVQVSLDKGVQRYDALQRESERGRRRSFDLLGDESDALLHPTTSAAPHHGEETLDVKIDHQPVFYFGGSTGTLLLMTFFPCLMYYLWLCQEYHHGQLFNPLSNQPFTLALKQLFKQVVQGAYPSAKAWVVYWGYIFFQASLYLTLPGVWTQGLPIRHMNNAKMDYFCNAVWAFYATIAFALVLHFSHFFDLTWIIDNFGPLMSVSIISGFFISFFTYFYTIFRGQQHKMTGYRIYDFFMGAPLLPRIGRYFDLKLFVEVRVPWFILFFLSLAAGLRQYEHYGRVTPQVLFLILAHWLYANACAKGEECIVPTWDMANEKWGFMLIFWNLAGVPFTYSHCTLTLMRHDPAEYAWPLMYNLFCYVLLLGSYYVFDTCNSQKNNFRAQMVGTYKPRKSFPQLPWRVIKDPTYIKCRNGGTLLTNAYARKLHYTVDVCQALSWALITGFISPIPYVYPVFLFTVLCHRARRDIEYCNTKYGSDWDTYASLCPYLFIPYIF